MTPRIIFAPNDARESLTDVVKPKVRHPFELVSLAGLCLFFYFGSDLCDPCWYHDLFGRFDLSNGQITTIQIDEILPRSTRSPLSGQFVISDPQKEAFNLTLTSLQITKKSIILYLL